MTIVVIVMIWTIVHISIKSCNMTDSQRMDSDSCSTITDISQLGSDVSTIMDYTSGLGWSNRRRRNAEAMARRRSNNPDFRAQEQMRNAESMALVRQDPVRRAQETDRRRLVRHDTVRRAQETTQKRLVR
jgi:hypothetical protein